MPDDEAPEGEIPDPTADLKLALGELVAAFRVMVASAQGSRDLPGYRSVNAARGLNECQALLDQGWDIIHPDFCEEVRQRSGVGRQPSVYAWTPYFIMARRETLVPQDRAAILIADEDRAMQHGDVVPEEAGPGGEPAPAAMPPIEGSDQQPIGGLAGSRGRRVTAQSPAAAGFEPTGALQGR